MAGTIEDPGLMVLSLQAIFALITKQESEYEFEVTASYLEVYNEVPSTLNLLIIEHIPAFWSRLDHQKARRQKMV
jgi:hypothetical protein